MPAITIPGALAADIAQHPERYRPSVFADGDSPANHILILASRYGAHGSVGYTGHVTTVLRDEVWVGWDSCGHDPSAPVGADGSPVIQQRGVTCWEPTYDRSPEEVIRALESRLPVHGHGLVHEPPDDPCGLTPCCGCTAAEITNAGGRWAAARSDITCHALDNEEG